MRIDSRIRKAIAAYAVGIVLTSGATGAILLLGRVSSIPNISLLYLPAILFIAVSFGTGPSLLSATVAVLEYDFFVLEPRFTLSINQAQDVLAFVIFVIVALLTSQLAAGARARAEAADRRARDSEALYDLGQALMTEQELPQVLRVVTSRTVQVLGVERCAIFAPDEAGQLQLAAEAPSSRIHDRETDAAVKWVYGEGDGVAIPARDTPGSQGQSMYIPLRTADRVVGVMEIGPRRSGEALDSEDRRLVSSLAAQTALVMVRTQGEIERRRRIVIEESSRAQSALLSAVSHDLRTPLASIKAAATALLLPNADLAQRDRRELLQAISQESDRLNRLVGNLLDLSRIEAGVLRPVLDWYDVHDVFDTVLPRLRHLLGARPFAADLPSTMPTIEIDLTRVEEMLYNLFENAAKYTPPDSPIELVVRHTGDGVSFSVVDHGPGVPERQRDRIFESFRRGQGHSDRHPGAGLGLAICRGIAEAHGGTMRVEETPGGGATLVFTLPASHVAQEVHG